MKRRKPTVTKFHSLVQPNASSSTSSKSTQKVASREESQKIYRPQILNVFEFNIPNEQTLKRSHSRQAYNRLRTSTIFQTLLAVGLVGLCVVLTIFRVFGTVSVIPLCAISMFVAQSITIRRPAGYLRNNEAHDACTLVAAHDNTMEWQIYTGDRGVVDTLVNKPMIILPEGKGVRMAATWFYYARVSFKS